MDSIAGKPIPLSTDLIGAEDPSGNLQPLQVTADGELLISGTFIASSDFAGTPGGPPPAEAAYVAGTDGSVLRPLKTDANGELQVDILTVPTVTVTGAVSASQSGAWNVGINNYPATQGVSGTVAATQSGTWTVGVNNFPATQAVSGSVTVSGTVAASQSGAWNVGINNYPATQGVSGTVAATQSGTWTVQPGNTANTTAWLVNSQAVTPAATTVKQAAITVGTSAVRLTTDGSAPSATRSILVFQPSIASSGNFYWGSSTVTSSGGTRGIQLLGGQIASLTNDAGDYYIISDSASQTVFVTEQE